MSILKTFVLATLSTSMMASTSLAKKTHSTRTTPLTPEEQLKTFKLPEGYVIELVASEKDGIINPIDLAFDGAGRLWTQTARMYPLDPVKDIKWGNLLKLMDDPEAQQKNPEFKRVIDLYQGKTKGTDQIIVLSNIYGGKKPKASTFAAGLAIPQSILPYKNGAYVVQGSELFYLEDTDSDGTADKRTPVLTGFGFTDTHTMAHTLVRGPGGWIYFSQGALNKGEVTAVKSGAKTRFDYSKIGRFSIDGQQLEVVSSGLNNIWGFWMKSDGQWWGTEANDFGLSITPMEPGTGFKGIGNQQIRPYQPRFPILHKFRVGGTGISGLAFMDDEAGSFPAQWKDVAFLANPITSTINTVRINRNDDGTVTAKHLPDFLTCEDDWFRPVNIEFGPDGCLYIADWYNKIVSHNEVPTGHPDRDKKHGRIWRIRHKGAPARAIANLYDATPNQLITHLSSPSAWEKRSAAHQIIDQNLTHLSTPLVKLAGDPTASESSRIHALWALEGIGHYDATLMSKLLTTKASNLRREAVRSMGQLAPDLTSLNTALAVSVNDPNPMVRSETLRTISDRGEANTGTIDILVTASKPEILGTQLGGPYERKFERYLARMALEKYAAPLIEYVSTPAAEKQPSSHLLWASQALPAEQRNQAFLSIWKNKNAESPIDESTFVIIASMLNVPEVAKTVTPALQNPTHGPSYVKYAIQHESQVQSPTLAQILTPVLESMLGTPKQQLLALDAIARLKAPVRSDAIVPLIDGSAKPNMVTAALKALQANPKQNLPAITQLASNKSIPFETRLSATHSLYQISPQQGANDVDAMLNTLALDEKRKLVLEFSGSKQGAALLMKKHENQSLPIDVFTLPSAERILQFNRKNPIATKILKAIRANETQEKQALAKRLEHLMKIPDQLKGDPAKGQIFFGTCLMCHKVGEKGFDIAPALDGSGHREREALLTAILNPDAAVESGYQVYRVRKKDDTTLEGYLFKDDKAGITLAFMGGSTVFIPAAEIATKGFAGGRSFMPKGLINGYSDQNVADLLAYIQTLK